MRLRWPIVAAWLVVVVVGFWASGRLSSLQSNVFTVPGTDAEHVRSVLQHRFGDRSDGAFTVVFRVGDSADPAVRARLQRVLDRGARAIPSGRGTALLPAGQHVLYGNVISTLDLAGAKTRTDDLVRAIGQPAGTRAYVTGAPAIQHDLDPIFSRDLAKGESIALPIALVVLLLVFGLSLGGADPVPVRGQHGAGDALARLCDRALHHHADVCHQPDLPDRARDRDRLLAADRLSLPRGAGARTGGRGRDRADDADRGAGGGLLRCDGGDRARAADLHAAPVHPRDRDRRLPAPGRLPPRGSRRSNRHCSRSSGGAACTASRWQRSSAIGCGCRCASPTGRTTSSTASGRAWRARSCGGSGATCSRPRRCSSRSPCPVAWLQLTPGATAGIPQSPQSVRGLNALKTALGPGAIAPAQVLVDTGRPGGVSDPAVAGRDRPAGRAGRGRPGGGGHVLPPRRALRRPHRAGMRR